MVATRFQVTISQKLCRRGLRFLDLMIFFLALEALENAEGKKNMAVGKFIEYRNKFKLSHR